MLKSAITELIIHWTEGGICSIISSKKLPTSDSCYLLSNSWKELKFSALYRNNKVQIEERNYIVISRQYYTKEAHWKWNPRRQIKYSCFQEPVRFLIKEDELPMGSPLSPITITYLYMYWNILPRKTKTTQSKFYDMSTTDALADNMGTIHPRKIFLHIQETRKGCLYLNFHSNYSHLTNKGAIKDHFQHFWWKTKFEKDLRGNGGNLLTKQMRSFREQEKSERISTESQSDSALYKMREKEEWVT